MIAAPPLDLTAAWAAHVEEVLADRDDAHRLHGSDLHACGFALWQRLQDPDSQLPNDDGAFAMFERGHAYEARVADAIKAYAIPLGYAVTHGEEVEYEGIVGHLDFTLERGRKVVAVIDVTTTAGKTTDWGYGHALKSAFYAVAKGADYFCEWVFRIGFGGAILGEQAWWFHLDDVARAGETWRELVDDAVQNARMIAAAKTAPEAVPPVDPRSLETETWRCGKSGKSYCRARCDYNARWKPL